MTKDSMITAAKIAGIPVIENSDTSGGIKFGECSIHDLVRFAQIVTNTVLETGPQDMCGNTQVAVVSDLLEYGPLITWCQRWSGLQPGTRFYFLRRLGL